MHRIEHCAYASDPPLQPMVQSARAPGAHAKSPVAHLRPQPSDAVPSVLSAPTRPLHCVAAASSHETLAHRQCHTSSPLFRAGTRRETTGRRAWLEPYPVGAGALGLVAIVPAPLQIHLEHHLRLYPVASDAAGVGVVHDARAPWSLYVRAQAKGRGERKAHQLRRSKPGPPSLLQQH